MNREDLLRLISRGLATRQDLEQFDAEYVVAMKRDCEGHARSYGGAMLPATTRQAEEEAADGEVGVRTRTFAATTQIVDRMGDIVMTRAVDRGDEDPRTGRGFETGNFLAAGAPFLWSHLSANPAIGQVSNPTQRRIDTAAGRVWSTLEAVEFRPSEKIPFSEAAVVLVDGGVLRSVSVGFVAVDIWRPDEKIRSRLGMPSHGLVFTTSDQTELSAAQTPANQLALDQGKALEEPMELRALRCFERAIEAGRISEGLVADFSREYPLGPQDEAERLRSRLQGFVDFGRAVSVDEILDPEPIELERAKKPKKPKPPYREDEEDEDEGKILEIPALGAPDPTLVAHDREVAAAYARKVDRDLETLRHLTEAEMAGLLKGLDENPGHVEELPMSHAEAVTFRRDVMRILNLEGTPSFAEVRIALMRLKEKAKAAEAEDPLVVALSGAQRNRIAEAFEHLSRATEELAYLQDELDDESGGSRSLDLQRSGSQPGFDVHALTRSVLGALADAIVTQGRAGSGSGGPTRDGERARATLAGEILEGDPERSQIEVQLG